MTALGDEDKVLPGMRRRFEELGCPDQVDTYGVGPHFVGGSSFFFRG